MHPLLDDINELTLDQISDKISEIDKRLIFYNQQSGNWNDQIVHQLNIVRSAYAEKFSEKTKEQLSNLTRKNGPEPDSIDLDD